MKASPSLLQAFELTNDKSLRQFQQRYKRDHREDAQAAARQLNKSTLMEKPTGPLGKILIDTKMAERKDRIPTLQAQKKSMKSLRTGGGNIA